MTDKRPDITKEVLRKYIDKGYSQNKIAIELGVTQATIFYKYQKYGFEARKTKPTKYNEQAMIRMLQNGWTLEQIANHLGVCIGTVGHWIHKYDLGKYRKAPQPQKQFDTKICRTCIYASRKELRTVYKCDYMGKTGHSRNMGQPESECSKYVKAEKRRKKECIS